MTKIVGLRSTWLGSSVLWRWQYGSPRAWELTSPVSSSFRLTDCVPELSLSFTWELLSWSVKRVNNSISPQVPVLWSPKCCENNQQPGSCQPRGKNNQLYHKALPMALWPDLFVHSEAMSSFRETIPQHHQGPSGASVCKKAGFVFFVLFCFKKRRKK